MYQTAKVAKVLLLLEKGRGMEFKGKSLSEIEVNEELNEESNSEDEIYAPGTSTQKESERDYSNYNFVLLTAFCNCKLVDNEDIVQETHAEEDKNHGKYFFSKRGLQKLLYS